MCTPRPDLPRRDDRSSCLLQVQAAGGEVAAAVTLHSREGGPERTGADQLIPAQREVGPQELLRICGQQLAGRFLPTPDETGVAQVHGPETIRVVHRKVHPTDLLGDLFHRHLRGIAEAGRAEEVVGDHGNSQAGQIDAEHVRDVAMLRDLQVVRDAGSERAGREAQQARYQQFPELHREVGAQVAERHRVDLIHFRELRHLLHQALTLAVGGGLRVEIGLDVRATPNEEAHHHLDGGASHGFRRDDLHHPNAGDRDRLFEAELAVLATAHADSGVLAVQLEGDRVQRVLRQELAEGHLRNGVPDRDRTVERSFEADHPAGDDPPDTPTRRPAEQVELPAVHRGGEVLADETGCDVPVACLVVGEAEIHPHAAGGHRADVDPGDPGPHDRLDDTEDVVDDVLGDVTLLGGKACDVHAVDDGDRREPGHQLLHELGVEDVHLRTRDVLDAGERDGVGPTVDHHRLERRLSDPREGNGLELTHDGVTNQTGTSEDQNGSEHGTSLTLDC